MSDYDFPERDQSPLTGGQWAQLDEVVTSVA